MPLCPVPLNSRDVALYYVAQTDCGKLPDNPTFKKVSFTGGSPVLNRETLQSAEIDGSSEVTGIRLGSAVVNLEIAFELKYKVHDDLIEYVMQSSWETTAAQTGKAVTIDAANKTATFSEDLNDQFKVGDIVSFKSATNAGNKAPLLVTAISTTGNTVLTLGAAKAANPQISLVGLVDETIASTDVAISDKIKVGTQRKLAAFLVEYNGITGNDKYQLIMDAEVTQFTFNPQVNANITGTFTVIGKTLASGQALPNGATLETLEAYKPLTGIDGALTEDGARVAFSESMNYTLNRAGEPSYELGDAFMSFVDYGKTTNELSITSKFVNFTTQQKFEAATQTDVAYNFLAAFDGDAIGFQWPTCALTGVSNTVGEGVIPQELTIIPYKPAGSQSSLIIHRVSNK